ncbi:MAG: hypothetical protein IJB39_07825 [Alistipes sp.]|nr:hypothetical protein [Alistipes sp.]
MRIRLYTILALALFVGAACSDDKGVEGISFEQAVIRAEAVGGSHKVQLNSSDRWIASTDNPWITILPANGVGSTMCEFHIDSALTVEPRRGVVNIRNLATNEVCEMVVEQEGFPYGITLKDAEVAVDSYRSPESRYFDVTVNTNIDFDVNIPEGAEWLSNDDYRVVLNRGERPRDVKIRFKWKINTTDEERLAQVSFSPKRDVELSQQDKLSVRQAGAEPIIPDTRAGDSIAVLNIARKINTLSSWESSDPMDMWDNVTLWDETMEGCTPENKGRVRSAQFVLFNTKETIPFEVRYLTAAEELYFFGNSNTFLLNIELGDEISELTQLKRLTIGSYGLISVPQSLSKLKNLEYLNLCANNFQTIPTVLSAENFPKLKALVLNANQRNTIYDLSNTSRENYGGFSDEPSFPEHLLCWNELDTLVLSVNYLSGELPSMDYLEKWTAEEVNACDTLPEILIGKPKVMPTTKLLAINLNRLSGTIPDWLLYHPMLDWWIPFSLVFPQEGRDAEGRQAGFDNEPVNLNYYYEHYTKKKLAQSNSDEFTEQE